MTKAIKYLIFPLLLAAILLAYYPSIDSSYHLDDFETIVANDLVDAQLFPLIKKYPTRWLVFLSYWFSLGPRSLTSSARSSRRKALSWYRCISSTSFCTP